MTRPETPFEAISYDLNKFRERRMAERRATMRDTPDRRAKPQPVQGQEASQGGASDLNRDVS